MAVRVSRVTYPSLEHVAMEKRPYPAELLEDCETGLVLFAAAFLGHNDAIHFAEAGVRTTCVDVDEPRLEEMRTLYRDPEWSWVVGDAWEYARKVRDAGQRFDAVSVDTFTGAATDRSLANLEAWTSIANRVVIATAIGTHFDIPPGWSGRLRRRSDTVDWLVLRPDEPKP